MVMVANKITKKRIILPTDNSWMEELYDMTPEGKGDDLPELNDDLTPEEIEEAPFYNQFKRGVMLITGCAGSGKDTTLHFLLWKLRTLFKGFKIILDRKPRPLLGAYIPFNTNILMQGYQASKEAYDGKKDFAFDFSTSKNKELVNGMVDGFMGSNKELFFNAGIGLGEFHRYFYNREPHNPMNRAISPLFKRYRHQELLVIGTTIAKDELDVKSCLRHITHEIRCAQSGIEGIHIATVYKARYFDGKKILEIADEKPIQLIIDALEPRDRLGGKCIYNLFNSFERGEFVPNIKFKV
jgi:hypothetical protein